MFLAVACSPMVLSAPLSTGQVDPAVTPETMRETICRSGYTLTIRPPVSYTEAMKRRQLKAWGYADQNPSHYEEDHIIPLELGGCARCPENLRPQPWAEAKHKDRRERVLHQEVCAGTTALAEAQRQMQEWYRGR